MKRVYILEGLDCANCAAKMEKAIAALDGVLSASVSFLTSKMVIEGDDDKFEEIVYAASKIVKKLEPGTSVRKA